MEEKKQNLFFTHNALFGLFVGLSYVVVSFLFLKTGREVSFNPQLNNVILMLSIVGAFVGVKKYRDQDLRGLISYKRALGACVLLLATAALLYGIYIYYVYHMQPELTENYLITIETALKETYKNSALTENMNAMLRVFTTPASIAFAEIFNKIITGTIFSLLIASFLRRKPSI